MRWISSTVSAVVTTSNGTPRMAMGGVAAYQRVGSDSIIQAKPDAQKRTRDFQTRQVASVALFISVDERRRVFKLQSKRMSREDREDREEDSRLFAFAIFAVFARHHSGGKLRRVNRREARPPSL